MPSAILPIPCGATTDLSPSQMTQSGVVLWLTGATGVSVPASLFGGAEPRYITAEVKSQEDHAVPLSLRRVMSKRVSRAQKDSSRRKLGLWQTVLLGRSGGLCHRLLLVHQHSLPLRLQPIDRNAEHEGPPRYHRRDSDGILLPIPSQDPFGRWMAVACDRPSCRCAFCEDSRSCSPRHDGTRTGTAAEGSCTRALSHPGSAALSFV